MEKPSAWNDVHEVVPPNEQCPPKKKGRKPRTKVLEEVASSSNGPIRKRLRKVRGGEVNADSQEDAVTEPVKEGGAEEEMNDKGPKRKRKQAARAEEKVNKKRAKRKAENEDNSEPKAEASKARPADKGDVISRKRPKRKSEENNGAKVAMVPSEVEVAAKPAKGKGKTTTPKAKNKEVVEEVGTSQRKKRAATTNATENTKSKKPRNAKSPTSPQVTKEKTPEQIAKDKERSRKCCAYGKALREARSEGLEESAAREKAKEVQNLVATLPTCMRQTPYLKTQDQAQMNKLVNANMS